MSDLYVRIKGRIQGPFPLNKLQSMVRRGQLSRIHQVSEDREVWQKAAEYPELFNASEPTRAASRADERGGQMETLATEAAPPQAAEQAWYVEENGQPRGPLSFVELQDLFRTGQHDASSLVWREGMHEWTAAESVDGLVSVAAILGKIAGQSAVQKTEPAESVDAQTIGILQESRGWVILCAVILTIWSLVLLALAFMFLVRGIRLNSDSIVLSAIITFGFSVVWGVLAFLIYSYSSALLKVRIERSAPAMNFALKRLTRLWVCFGCILLLGVLLFLVSFVLEITQTSNFTGYW